VGQSPSDTFVGTCLAGYPGIRAQPNVAQDTSFNEGRNSAILRYVGAIPTEPSKNHTSPGPVLLEPNLHVGTFTSFPSAFTEETFIDTQISR
jgi:hypothetical protein